MNSYPRDPHDPDYEWRHSERGPEVRKVYRTPFGKRSRRGAWHAGVLLTGQRYLFRETPERVALWVALALEANR